MSQFDLLGIEADIQDGKIVGQASGPLAGVVQPAVQKFLSTLNSLKVIAKVDGKHVFNLYNPPQPTKAGMRFLARKVKETVYKMPFPVTANLAVTYKCQCKCIHCSADPFMKSKREEVTSDDIRTVVDGALDLGANIIIYTGGEPLLKEDLCDLIDYVDKDKAVVMIFTNGVLLDEDRVKRLADAGLFSLNISIDSCDPKIHNDFRKVPECYEKAMAGAARAREAGILTGISTYATGEGLREGRVERLLQIGQEQGFHEVTIFDCIPSGRFLKNADLILKPEERKELIALAKKYHGMDHPMGISCMAIINSAEGSGCYGASSQFYMTAYGDINPCDFNPISFGNIREMPVQAIWQKMTSHQDFKHKHPTCRMQTPAYRSKYIDPLPDDPELPIPIEQYPMDASKAESQATSQAARA